MFQWSVTERYVPGGSQKDQNARPSACSFVSCTEKAQQPRLVCLAEAAMRYAVWKVVLHECQRTGLDKLTGLCFYLQKQFSNLVFCFRITCFFSKLIPSCQYEKLWLLNTYNEDAICKNTAGLVQKVKGKIKTALVALITVSQTENMVQ